MTCFQPPCRNKNEKISIGKAGYKLLTTQIQNICRTDTKRIQAARMLFVNKKNGGWGYAENQKMSEERLGIC